MKKITILTSKGTSLKVVADDIAYSALKHGITASVQIGMMLPVAVARNSDRIIIFIPFDPNYVLSWISLYHTFKKAGKDVVFYTTVEGIPDPSALKPWVPKVVEPIANSEAVASWLSEVGIKVAGIVRHGVNMEMADRVRKPKTEANKKRIVFGTVAFSHPRKGFDELEKIIQKALDRLPEATFHVISQQEVCERLSKYPNVIADPMFSQLERMSLLKRMASFDFYLCTSKAEGFCLPILEAQALGVPVIHADYKPLSEISHPGNLKVEVEYVHDVKLAEAVIYRFHEYSADEMFERVAEACDLYRNRHDEYMELSEKLVEHARKFDAIRMYEPLVM